MSALPTASLSAPAALMRRARCGGSPGSTLADRLLAQGAAPTEVHGRVTRALFPAPARFWFLLRAWLDPERCWDAEWLLAECLGRCRTADQVRQCHAEYLDNPARSRHWLEQVFFQPTAETVREAYLYLQA